MGSDWGHGIYFERIMKSMKFNMDFEWRELVLKDGGIEED